MKPIENGVVQVISPSMLDSFDASTPFGCERRGWFKYVAGLKEPQSDNMVLGEQLHSTLEKMLTGQPVGEVPSIVETLVKQSASWIAGIEKRIVGVEAPMPEGFTVQGIPVSPRSRCDAVTDEPSIIDWKTTSDIEKYGKTPGQLAKNTQMLIYARAFHPTAEKVILRHGQFQTKGKPLFRVSEVTLDRKTLDSNFESITIPLVEKIRQVARETEARAVTANRNACRMCPHKGICPADKENPLMSIFAKFRQTPAAPTAPTSQPITPPDAPKSDPALAAKPVEGFEPKPATKHKFVDVDAPARESVLAQVAAAPVVMTSEQMVKATDALEPVKSMTVAEFAVTTVHPGKADMNDPKPSPPPVGEKRRPGRPPGSKNKPKDAPVAAPAPISPAVTTGGAEILEPVNEDFLSLESVTVSYGLTLNMGDYNSARIDVSMTARCSDSMADAAYEALLGRVKAKVEAEVSALANAKGGK